MIYTFLCLSTSRYLPVKTIATPIDILESYFDERLETKSLKRFDEVTKDQWVDFAKHYLGVMESSFSEQFLSFPNDEKLRLYFEPRMTDAWGAAVKKAYLTTPLLGISPHPPEGLSTEAISRLLDPLKKHLLFGDAVYLRDSFYSCFDAVADSVDRYGWRKDQNALSLVELSIKSLKGWLPILVELRDLVESNVLVFMPYYITPSFPYDGNSPQLRKCMKRLRIHEAIDRNKVDKRQGFSGLHEVSEDDVPSNNFPHFNWNEVLGAWMNARLLRLDPVFPDRAMFDWASRLYFADDPQVTVPTSDFISMSILPFGDSKGMTPRDLMKIRKNEEVFWEIRRAVSGCKVYVEENIAPGSTREGVRGACESFLRDQLAAHERNSVLKFFDENPVATICCSIALGAAFVGTPGVVGVVAGAVLTPRLARIAQSRFDRKRRAIGHLQALL